MSISLVVGGLGSGRIGYQGTVSVSGSFAHCVAVEVTKFAEGVVLGIVVGGRSP